MAEKNILHMLTPTQASEPVRREHGARCRVMMRSLTYTNVALDEVTGLVQDAIFSRPPKVGARTGMFFGGKNASAGPRHAGEGQEGAGAAVRVFRFLPIRPARSRLPPRWSPASKNVLKNKKQRDLKG